MTETTTRDPGAPAAGTDPFGGSGGGGVRAAAHEADEQVRSIAETGKEEAAKVIGEVRSQTSNLVGEASQQMRDRAESQVGHAARALGDMSDELDRMAASSMSDSPVTMIARDGATAMRSISRRLDEGGLDAAMEDVRRFARRRPVAFLSGAFAIGMIAGRLVRNTDVDAVKQQLQHGEAEPASTTLDTGTTSRIEEGMTRGLDDALAVEAGMPLGSTPGSAGSTDLSAGVEADWNAPTLQGSATPAAGHGGQG